MPALPAALERRPVGKEPLAEQLRRGLLYRAERFCDALGGAGQILYVINSVARREALVWRTIWRVLLAVWLAMAVSAILLYLGGNGDRVTHLRSSLVARCVESNFAPHAIET